MTALPVSEPINGTRKKGAERRRSIRHACELEALVWHAAAGEQEACWPAKIKDISKGGIGLILPRPFEPGVVFTFELRTPDRSFSRTVLVCAVRTEPITREEWLVGCTFASKISEEEILTLIAQVGMDKIQASPPPENGKSVAPVRIKKLTRKQDMAVTAFLEDTNVSSVADALSVSQRTLRGWLALPEFQQALYRARQKSVDSSLSRLLRLSDRAATILETNLTCGQPAVEVQAAGEVLRLALAGSWNASYEP